MEKDKQKNINKARPKVKIILDKERTLKLDLNAMASFEEATGINLMDGSFQAGRMSSKSLRAMLWACLVHEDETLTEKQVGSWVTVDNMLEVASKLNEAFEVAMPKGEGKKGIPLAESPGG